MIIIDEIERRLQRCSIKNDVLGGLRLFHLKIGYVLAPQQRVANHLQLVGSNFS